MTLRLPMHALAAAVVAALAGGPLPADGQDAEPQVPDSLAHPIVLGCGDRIDPPAILWKGIEVGAVSAAERDSLAVLETSLRATNAPLGATWHEDPITQPERARLLEQLQSNYRSWWRDVGSLLGPDRAESLMTAPPALRGSRCLERPLAGVLGLGGGR